MFDTLPFARNKYPGARASLDALCKRFGIDNSHRELHGALLDAEILADVYLVMTGGQYSLMDFNETENVAKQGDVRLSSDRAKLKVISCTTEERDAHRNRLEAIKQSSGVCLWNDE